MIEQLAEEDSIFGDLYLEGDERMHDPSQLQQAIRRVLLRRANLTILTMKEATKPRSSLSSPFSVEAVLKTRE